METLPRPIPESALLPTRGKMCTPVLPVAGLVVLPAERPLFAVRDGRESLALESLIGQKTANRLGAFLPENEIIGVRPALIAMPFNDHPHITRVSSQRTSESKAC